MCILAHRFVCFAYQPLWVIFDSIFSNGPLCPFSWSFVYFQNYLGSVTTSLHGFVGGRTENFFATFGSILDSQLS